MKFSDKVFYLRQKHKLTQVELAEKVHVKQSTIQAYESGRAKPFYGKTLDYHITRKGLTAEELSARSQISTQIISELRNKTDKKFELKTLMKLFIGLNLNSHYCMDLLHKAGYLEFPKTQEGLIFEWLVKEHTTTDTSPIETNNCKLSKTLCKRFGGLLLSHLEQFQSIIV